jgi:hypothetical protein
MNVLRSVWLPGTFNVVEIRVPESAKHLAKLNYLDILNSYIVNSGDNKPDWHGFVNYVFLAVFMGMQGRLC